MGDGTGFSGDFRGGEVNFKPTVNKIFASAVPSEVAAAELSSALSRFSSLPLDVIPPVAALPAGSVMPLAPNPLFIGRQSDLRTLAQAIASGGTAAIGQIKVIAGLAGMGKTQLAAEFAHRYGHYFQGGVFWLSFADPDAIPGEIARCGGAAGLGLSEDFEYLPLEQQLQMVSAAWHGPLPRLLIFDNCEDESLVEGWRPTTGGCRVLVTSRRLDWSPHLGVEALPLGGLARDESLDLLHRHRNDLALDDPDLNAIADELGDLPLALHLAGIFLRQYRHAPLGEPARYLAALRAPDLLQHPSLTAGGASPTRHDQHIARTFALSWQRLDGADGTDVLAMEALARLACFATGEPVPRWLLLASLGQGEDDAAQMNTAKALQRLTDLGLVEAEKDGALILHRLLAAYIRKTADGLPEALAAVEQAVEEEADKLIAAGYPAPLQAWQVHLRAVAEAAAEAGGERASGLLLSLGNHLQMAADLDGAQAAYERALAIQEAIHGPGHPEVATAVNSLGSVLRDKGDLDGAQAAFERALVIHEATYGPEHPNVAADVNNLGSVLRDKGDLDGAQSAFERALAIDEASHGPDHLNVRTTVNNMGLVLHYKGDLDGAQAAFERALAIDEAAHGPDHPNVATDVNNLALVLQDKGDLDGAQAAYQRALAIGEATHGPDHPNVATTVNNLGRLLQARGNLDGAQAAYRRAIAIDEATYGPDHPEVAIDIHNLGSVLQEKGDLDGAQAAYQRALAIYEAAYGPDQHPNVAMAVNNLGSVLHDKGDLDGAQAAFERALAINDAIYGPEHPNVATTVNNLGGALQDKGDLDGAQAAFERALAIDEATHGPDHPNVAIRISNLGGVLRAKGNLYGAKSAFERALFIDETVYGTDHPNIAKDLNNLGNVLREQGDPNGARAAFERALAIVVAVYGPLHPAVAISENNLGSILHDLGDLRGAKAAYERASAAYKAIVGPEHPVYITVSENLKVTIKEIENSVP